MWSLIQTVPNWSARAARSARPTSRVQTDAARPYGTSFAHASAFAAAGLPDGFHRAAAAIYREFSPASPPRA